MQAHRAGSIGATYSVPTTYTAGSIGPMTVPMTAAPRTATFANAMPTLGSINTGMPMGSMQVIGSSSVVQQPMPVQMPFQIVQAAGPMTTTAVGYAGGYQQVNQAQQQVNQAQMAYNMQVQGINQAIQMETQIEKQLDSQKANKEALDKKAKVRELENKRYELKILEMELTGNVDPQVQRSHDRQNFVNKAADEQDKVLQCQHDAEEQKIKALQAQLALAKFDAGQIDADGKEIRAPESAEWLKDDDVLKLIKEKKEGKGDKGDKKEGKDDKGDKKEGKDDKGDKKEGKDDKGDKKDEKKADSKEKTKK